MTQRVLVTAGASGIGLAIAEAFAADGARVHVADIDPDAIDRLADAHEQITGSGADVSDIDAVNRLFEDIGAKLGGPRRTRQQCGHLRPDLAGFGLRPSRLERGDQRQPQRHI